MRIATWLCGALLAASAAAAEAQIWVNAGKDVQIETESMAIDENGYVLFKTRDLKEDGTPRWQHKEAVHCGRGTHSYRQMYDASEDVRSPSNEDAFPKWRDNQSEISSERHAAVQDFVCSRNVGEVGIPVCDELIRKQRACWQSVSDVGVRAELQQIATRQAATLRAMSGSSMAETVCRADLDIHRKDRDYGCDW